MSARSRRTKKLKPRRERVPLTAIQRERAKLLIDLGITQADIAKAIGESRSNVSAVFLDKFRSLGPDGIEQRVIHYLQKIAGSLGSDEKDQAALYALITRERFGWTEIDDNETPVPAEASTGES